MDVDAAWSVVRSEAALTRTERVQALDEGFSPDRKFVLFEGGVARHLLRLGEASGAGRRRGEYEVLGRLGGMGALAPRPVCFGEAGDGGWYMGTTYIAGEDAERVLATLEADVQYELGLAAGGELRRLHELKPEDDGVDWVGRHLELYEPGVRAAERAGIEVPGGDVAAAFVSEHGGVLEGVTPALMHNDFYPANLIVDAGRLSGVVDFELWDWGDPVHDFHKMTWFGVRTSVPFSVGQVRGYAGGEPTDSFWRRYHLHVAMSLPRMLAFIAAVDPWQLVDWMERAEEIVTSHDFASGGAPTWYAGYGSGG